MTQGIGRVSAANFVMAAAVGLGALAIAPTARASIVLEVNGVTGDLELVGKTGDTLSSYDILSASGADVFDYANWNADRFGGTPAGATAPTSVADGYGMWHAMGTVAPATGQTTTSQLGEMSAVYAGYATNGLANSQTSKSFTFTASDTTIDLGDEFIPGSVENLVFAYGSTPGFYNTWLFDGLTHTYSITTAGSYYQGDTFTSSGVTGAVEFVPEPGTALLIAVPVALLAFRRRVKAPL